MPNIHKIYTMKYIDPQVVRELEANVSIIVSRVLLNNARIRIELNGPSHIDKQAIRSLYRACTELYTDDTIFMPRFGSIMRVGEVRSIFEGQWERLPRNSFAPVTNPI